MRLNAARIPPDHGECSYLTVVKSFEHSARGCAKKLNLVWVDASNLEDQAKVDNPAEFHKTWRKVCTANSILVLRGIGHRGTEGMIQAAMRVRRTRFLVNLLGHAACRHRIHSPCLRPWIWLGMMESTLALMGAWSMVEWSRDLSYIDCFYHHIGRLPWLADRLQRNKHIAGRAALVRWRVPLEAHV
jgi:hypothetical protein